MLQLESQVVTRQSPDTLCPAAAPWATPVFYFRDELEAMTSYINVYSAADDIVLRFDIDRAAVNPPRYKISQSNVGVGVLVKHSFKLQNQFILELVEKEPIALSEACHVCGMEYQILGGHWEVVVKTEVDAIRFFENKKQIGILHPANRHGYALVFEAPPGKPVIESIAMIIAAKWALVSRGRQLSNVVL